LKKYLIIPACSDYNRGDQALVWESIRLAQEAGFDGEYYLLASDEPTSQSQNEGIKIFNPLLEHPSRIYKNRNNIEYNTMLKLKWGSVAIFDLVSSLFLLMAIKLKFPMTSFSKRKTNTIELYKQSEAIFVKGGGFLQSYGGLVAGYFIYYNIYHMLIAIVLKKPLYILPNSIGPLDGFMVKPMMKYVFKNAKVVMCRESISEEYVNRVFGNCAKLCPDLAFYLESYKQINTNEYLNKKDIPFDNKKCVAITVRPYRFPNSKNGHDLYIVYIKSMIVFSEYIIDKGYFPVFIQHTLANNSHEDDTLAIKQITTKLSIGTYGTIMDPTLNCRQLKSLYSTFYCIIGTRFHSVIFSISSGVPAIAIAYGGNKSIGIMKDIQQYELVIPIEEMEAVSLIRKFNYLSKNYESIRKNIHKAMDSIYEYRTELIKILNEKWRK